MLIVLKSSYLHTCDPPIIHGDLSCETIFIQHNGLIKIGCIAPDIVNTHVKTVVDNMKWSRNMHFIAPEIRDSTTTSTSNTTNNNSSTTLNIPSTTTTDNNTRIPEPIFFNKQSQMNSAVDIYAFGMVALEVISVKMKIIWLKHRL